MQTFFKKNQRKDGGYTLLFAAVVASLVLSIGLSILTISKKEFLLATNTRNSSAALYAADSALDCGIYADEAGAFDNVATIDPTPLFETACHFPHSITSTWTAPADPATFVVHVRTGELNQSCAVITVTKQTVGVQLRTIIDARGYNTGWDSAQNTCNVPSAKRVERGVRYVI